MLTVSNILLSNLLLASLGANVLLIIRLRKSKRTRPQSLELREFLADLATGSSLIKVQRLSPGDVFLRSSREMQ